MPLADCRKQNCFSNHPNVHFHYAWNAADAATDCSLLWSLLPFSNEGFCRLSVYCCDPGFSLNYSAYFAEIYRSGIQALPKGQLEAAQVLGYSKSQTFFHITLPQLIKQVLPAITNEIITLVKDTSLAFAIAVAEMFTMAKQLAAAQATIVPLMIAGLYYYLFNLLVSFVMEKIEKHYDYYSN